MAHGSTFPDIGRATEALLMAAFSETCLLTAKATARLLGMDVKTLDNLADDQTIRAVRRGNLRAYTEGDIRTYLTESVGPCPSINQPRAPTSNTTSKSKVVDFMALRASQRAARPKK